MERQDNALSNIDCSDLTAAGELFGETGTDNTLTYKFNTDDYLSGGYAPGTYVVTIGGTGDNSASSQSQEATFTFTLVDPCDPPASIQVVSLPDQVYTITDDSAPVLIRQDFTSSPAYCPLVYTYTINDITNLVGKSAITLDEGAFVF